VRVVVSQGVNIRVDLAWAALRPLIMDDRGRQGAELAVFRYVHQRNRRVLGGELRLAARRLRWSPGFAALAVGILVIGVGTNAAMFALIDALLLRPPNHVAEPERAVRLQFRPKSEQSFEPRIHYPAFAGLRHSDAFASVAAYTEASGSIGAGEGATPANMMLVSHEFFQLLGTQPRLGSFLPAGDRQADDGDWAILSYGFWRRQLGGESHAIGAKLTIDGKAYTVVAVTPDGFPSLSAAEIDVWLPLEHLSVTNSTSSGWRKTTRRPSLSIIGRLAPGTSRSVAEARATSTLQSRPADGADDDETPWEVRATSIVPGRDDAMPLETRVSFWLAAVSTVLLFIACANVSNLVLTRALAQRREFFIRRALGASRWNLNIRSLADTCVIVVPGALGATIVSFLLRNVIVSFVPGDVPVSRILWDERTTAMVVASAGLAFVLIQAASFFGLRMGSTATGLLASSANGKPIKMGARRTLLAVQSGLCLTLVFVAALFAMSLRRVESLDLGAALDRTIQVNINLAPQHRGPGEQRAIYEQAHRVLTGHPGVQRVALATSSPFMSGSGIAPRTAQRGREELWPKGREVAYQSVVGPGFFSTVGARSLRGRDFSEGDRMGAERVAIINVPLAHHLWPSEEALGQCMWVDKTTECVRVVGVLGGVWKLSALERDKMAVYLPLAQVSNSIPGILYIQPKGDVRSFLPSAISLIQTVRPDLPAARSRLLRDVVDPEFRPWRLGTTVFTGFAAVALLITSIGLYGVVAAGTTLRLKEIGVRLALGASPAHVLRVIVGDSLSAVTAGLLGAIVLGVAAGRLLSGVLFQTAPSDPLVLIQTACTFVVVAALAVMIPTIRALRTDPTKVLRAK
jgi:putative ABC transport system permease protein